MLGVPTVLSHGKAVLIQKAAPKFPAANRLKAPQIRDHWEGPEHGTAQRASNASAPSIKPDLHARLSAVLFRTQDNGQENQRPSSDLITDALATLLVGSDDNAALTLCERLLASHMDRTELADDALAPAIRLLGKRWDQDRLCFSDMTVAVARTQLISRSWRATVRPDCSAGSTRPVLFAALSRQRHVLGVILAAHAFREYDQWETDLLLNASDAEVVRNVKTRRPHIVGFTVGERRDAKDVYRAILKIRALPFYPKVLVGGNAAGMFAEHCSQFLVDAIVPDIASALAAASD